MAHKKVILVIVEGPSDEEALGVLLGRIYDKNSVFVKIMHGDITTASGIGADKILSAVGNIVRKYAAENHFKKDDFREVLHIVDTDGAFVADDAVIPDATANRPYYLPNGIHTANKAGIEARNAKKAANLNRLIDSKTVWGVPYGVYYMSCNLDHVLYDRQNSAKEEKEENSFRFALYYRDRIPEFIEFVKESDFSVKLAYRDSWEYIKVGNRSLERHSNFWLCLPPNGTP